MSQWPMVALVEMCEQERTVIRSDDPAASDLPFVGLEQVASGTGEIVHKLGSRTGEGKSTTFRFDERHVLYGKLRPYLNKVAVPDFCGKCSTELVPILPRNGVERNYLALVLRRQATIDAVMAANTGARMPRADMKVLLSLKAPLPPLSEQRRIVDILNRANGIRRLRREAQEKARQIIPALFVEMFGDPASNPKGWPFITIGNLFRRDRPGTRCGPFGTALKKHEYVDDGIPVWGINNVRENEFVEQGSLFITEEKYTSLMAYSVEAGNILISRAGTVGRMCVARPSRSPSIIGTNLILVSLDTSKVTPDYITALFTHFPRSVASLRATGESTAYSFMKTTVLKQMQIVLPPLPLQQAFASRVNDIQAMITQQDRMGEASDELTNALMAQMFDDTARSTAEAKADRWPWIMTSSCGANAE